VKQYLAAGLVLFAQFHPTPASGQDRALKERTVPLELVEALLASRAGEAKPIVLVGALPPQMQAMYLPASSRIIGSMSSSASATAVIASSLDQATIRREYVREASARGWKAFGTGNATMGGFRDVTNTGPLSYCDGSTLTLIKIDAGSLGESRVTISQSSEGVCNYMQQQQQQQMRAMGDPMLDLRWPILVNPDNTHRSGDCGFGQRPSFASPAIFMTPMTADQLFEHYGKQLADLGWVPAQNLPTRSWQKKDSTGINLLMELSVQTIETPPGCRKVQMRTNAWR